MTMKSAYSHNREAPIHTHPQAQSDSGLQLVPSSTATLGSQYQVRVGNKLFQGSDTRHLLKLAVQARRSQLRAEGSGHLGNAVSADDRGPAADNL